MGRRRIWEKEVQRQFRGLIYGWHEELDWMEDLQADYLHDDGGVILQKVRG